MGVRKTIVTSLAEYGIDIRHEGQVLRAFCPFHNDTGRPNFTVYPDTNSWYCWACKEGGDVIAFVAKMENITYGQAKNKLEGIGIDLTELQEKIDGVGLEEEVPLINATLNVTVSKMVREFLRQKPNQVEGVLSILKGFDAKLAQPVNATQINQILTNLKQELQKL